MPSNELVPTGTRELAVLDDESPCPVFDHLVRTTVLEIDHLARNDDIFPDDRRIEREHLEYALRNLVNEVESGKWTEPMPEVAEPDMYQEVETRELGPKRALWSLSDSEIAAKFNKLAEHLALMDAEHQAGLKESVEHQEALREIWGER